MNVSFHPQAAAHRPSAAPAPQPSQTSTETAPSGEAGDTVELSAAAQQLLSAQKAGKAQPHTPAGQAAAALAGAAASDETDGAPQPFGQIVRGFTPGHLKHAAAAAEPTGEATEVAGDETATDPTAVQDDSGVVEDIVEDDGSDVAAAPDDETADEGEVASSEPDIGELLEDDETPAEQTAADATSEPESAPEETPVAGDPAGDLLDELLDGESDEGGDETVA